MLAGRPTVLADAWTLLVWYLQVTQECHTELVYFEKFILVSRRSRPLLECVASSTSSLESPTCRVVSLCLFTFVAYLGVVFSCSILSLRLRLRPSCVRTSTKHVIPDQQRQKAVNPRSRKQKVNQEGHYGAWQAGSAPPLRSFIVTLRACACHQV